MSPSDILDAPVSYYDGRRAMPHPVRLTLADGRLHIHGQAQAIDFDLEARRLTWPERQRHGPRVMLLPYGGQLHCHDGPAWDTWAARHPLRHDPAVRLQQSWRGTALAAVLFVALMGAGYGWGLPWLARGVLVVLPASVDASVGDTALAEIDTRWLAPSRLPEATQARLRAHLGESLERHAQATGTQSPAWNLQFRRSRDGQHPGPNAFALPGGTLVLTDELATLLQDHEDVLLGVLAHELGHVRQRHGMRMLTQATLLGAATTWLFGDAGGLLANVPLLLGQLAYSRDAEREADDEAIAVLQASGVAPSVMVTLFDRLQAATKTAPAGDILPIAFATHPPDAERIARFQAATGRATTGNRN